MAHSLMDSAAIQQWILRKLGAPFVKVELGEDHLKDAVEDAQRWFASKKGFRAQSYMQIAGIETALPDEVDTVLEVQFTASGNDIDRVVDPLHLVDGFPAANLIGGGGGGMGGLLSSYVQMTQYLQTASRVLGSELEWWQEGRKLIILPPTAATIRLDYKANKFTVEQLNERDHDMVKRKALALAKETLGRIRSKFDAYPTAQGSVTLDGPTLLGESQGEQERLEEEIAQSGYPIGFLVG